MSMKVLVEVWLQSAYLLRLKNAEQRGGIFALPLEEFDMCSQPSIQRSNVEAPTSRVILLALSFEIIFEKRRMWSHGKWVNINFVVRNAPVNRRSAEFWIVSIRFWFEAAMWVKIKELYSSTDRIKLLYNKRSVLRSPPHRVEERARKMFRRFWPLDWTCLAWIL